MTYIRSDKPNLTTPLSREELRVFTSVRDETSLETIIAKSKLDEGLVKDVLMNLMARGLVFQANETVQTQAASTVTPETSTVTPETSERWLEQRQAVENFLRARLGEKKATSYIARLQDCANQKAFIAETQSIAKSLALVVNAKVGEQLLAALNR